MATDVIPHIVEDGQTARVIAALTRAASRPETLDGVDPSAFIVPADARLEVVSPEQFDHLNQNPRRAKGTVSLGTLPALIDYLTFHADDLATSIWVAPETGKVIAVVNDHAGREGSPGWGDHRAVFAPRTTVEWKRWIAADGTWLDQERFAELLEDGLTEIADPAGATLFEIASTMVGKTEVSWEQATRLDNGAVRARYVEDVDAKAGTRGDLEIPTRFTLVLPIFYGEADITIEARLRWRLRQGKLFLSFKLDNPHRAIETVVQGIATQLSGAFAHVYIGEPR